MADISQGHEPGKGGKLTPIFITKAEKEKFHSIDSKTKKQIKDVIIREIEQLRSLGADDVADHLLDMWKRQIEKQTREAYLMFYKTEVCVALDETLNNHPLLGKYKSTLLMFHN